MSRHPWVLHVVSIAALIIAFSGSAEAGSIRQPMLLGDAQLDEITAGAFAFATGSGTGTAQGMLSSTQVSVASATGLGGQIGGAAAGLVTASAASSAGPLASASSTLSLTVICP